MIKKFLLISLSLIMMSMTCSASPLTDYTAGKTAIDLNLSPKIKGDYYFKNSPGSLKADSDRTFDWKITTGLGNKFALQYGQYKTQAPINSSFEHITDFKELNVLYQINKNLSALVGYNWTKYHNEASGSLWATTNSRGAYQIGLVGNTKLDSKTSLFGTVAYGPRVSSWDIGMGYAITKDIEANVTYKYAKQKDMVFVAPSPVPGEQFDVQLKGISYGITYKF